MVKLNYSVIGVVSVSDIIFEYRYNITLTLSHLQRCDYSLELPISHGHA